MPNAANVDAPIVLVGPGRSGTSLVSDIFARHPDCAFAGETANFIFGIWDALRTSAGVVPPLVEDGAPLDEDERAARAVRQAFLSNFHDNRRHWMQKPIGVPRAIGYAFAEDRGSDAAGAAYWHVLRTTFPRARYITVLRHPCDVVLSGVAKWGIDEATLWRALADLSRYLTHAAAPPVHAVVYDDLVREPEPVVRAMCDGVGLTFDRAMLEAFRTVHVAAPGRDEPARTAFSRRHEWDALDPAALTPPERAAIEAAFAKFGRSLTWPDGLGEARDAPPGEAAGADRIAELERQLRHQGAVFERTRLAHEQRARDREEEFERRAREREEEIARVYTEQRDWIAELERARGWLEAQMRYWRAEAERLRHEGPR